VFLRDKLGANFHQARERRPVWPVAGQPELIGIDRKNPRWAGKSSNVVTIETIEANLSLVFDRVE